MTRDEVLAQLRSVASDLLEVDPDSINEDTVLGDDLEVDSLDVIDVVLSLEREYGIAIEEAELRSLTTAGDVITLILQKTEQLQAPA